MDQLVNYSFSYPAKQTSALVATPYVNNKTIINPVAVNDKEGRLAVRSKIDQYEQTLKDISGSEKGDMDSINDNGLHEHFVGGAYIRELFIPEDTTIVSQIWNKDRFWIIATGEVTFTTEMGTQRVKAPFTKFVEPGSKVALYTHKDTLWFAITGTETMNKDEIESEVIAKDYQDYTYPWEVLE